MILYTPAHAMRFVDYGILIPVLDSRAAKVVERLNLAAPSGARTDIVEGLEVAARILQTGVDELKVSREDLERVHDSAYVARLFGEEDGKDERGRGLERELLSTYELIGSDGKPHRYEPEKATRPLTALFDSILAQVAGSYTAARLALSASSGSPGFVFYLGGGMHHARRDAGSGFCLVNDIMIAVARLRAEGRIKTVWVIDIDAHKGDGTAEIAAADEDTLTLSIHMAAGWPLDSATIEAARKDGRGEDRAPIIPSDVELPIAKGEDDRYTSVLAEGLILLERMSAKPDLAIVVDGADPYKFDGLPSSADLALSLDQCLERDLLVHRFLTERAIPAAWLMAGGYGSRAWEPPARFLETLQG
jgi:acetoin utilization deacetylase AcuC-like enzyme